MKKTIFTSSAIILLAALACSNEKDPQPAPKSRTDLLTSHEWRPFYVINSSGDTLKFSSCQMDNTLVFGKGGSYRVKVNQKCDSMETDLTGSWKFLNNETEIVIVKNLLHKVQTDTATIASLTDEELIVEGKGGKQRIVK